MPIAILKFRLPEEQDDFDRARLAPKYVSAFEEYYQWIRGKSKYGGPEDVPSEAYQACFDEFMRICQGRGFDPLSGLP